jgi:hypothetical protein
MRAVKAFLKQQGRMAVDEKVWFRGYAGNREKLSEDWLYDRCPSQKELWRCEIYLRRPIHDYRIS